MTTPEDRELETRELEALLREQTLLPLPLALVARIVNEVLPAEPVRPWAVVGRAAAAVIAFCASWLAFAGGAPAFADVAPEAHVAAAVGSAAVPATLRHAVTTPPILAEATGPSAALWLLGGCVLMVAGLVFAWRGHTRAVRAGGDA